MSHAKHKTQPAPSADDEQSSPEAAESAPLVPDQIETLKTQAVQSDENWNRYLRALADLENYKKRAARERQDAVKFANESLLQKLVPILDNFEMAQAAAQSSQSDSIQSGVAMIQQQLKAALTEAGLEEVDATGQPFDPNQHEAVSQQETADVPEGHVLQQLRKGYRFRDRLLRPATVIVAKKPAA